MIYFLEDFDIANYADNSTPYCARESAEFVVNNSLWMAEQWLHESKY